MRPLIRKGGKTKQGDLGEVIHAAASKGTPADADELALADSQASWSLKKLSWGNLKASIWSAFKTIVTGGSAKDTLGLGTAATRDVGTAIGNVMVVGAGGWLSRSPNNSYISGYPQSFGENITQAYRRESIDAEISAYASSIHFAAYDTWGRLRLNHHSPQAWVQGGVSTTGAGWTAELHHTGNILSTTGQSTQYPMTQKAVTDAINARGFEDASGILTATSGVLSNDMSSFLSQTTKATMRSNLEVPQLNASATEQGGLKARLVGTTLYLTNNGTNP